MTVDGTYASIVFALERGGCANRFQRVYVKEHRYESPATRKEKQFASAANWTDIFGRLYTSRIKQVQKLPCQLTGFAQTN